MGNFGEHPWGGSASAIIRREVWNEARRAGMSAVAKQLKGARYALWKNPQNLTARQTAKLADIARTNQRLYRAYLLKEQLRLVFHQDTPEAAVALLDRWLAWVCRCRIPAFVALAKRIRRHRQAIINNARARCLERAHRVHQHECDGARLIHRRAFGFKTPEAMISIMMLALGGLCPPLPGRP